MSHHCNAIKNLSLITQVPRPPNFKKKIIELARITEKESLKGHFIWLIHKCGSDSKRASNNSLVLFLPNFHLAVAYFFLHYFGSTTTAHPLSPPPSTSLQRSRGFDAAVGLATWKYTALANVELPQGTKEESSCKTHSWKVEDYGGKGGDAGREKERIPCITRRSFVVKLLYRPAIITARVVGYSTKDTARL